MNEHASWSLHLGRWGGVHVRLHVFFLLFAVFTLYLSWRDDVPGAPARVDWVAVAGLSLLLVGVLLHECGHVWIAARHGGVVEELVLGPLGGLGTLPGLEDPRAELGAYLAGPLVNLAVCLACAPVLYASGQGLFGLLWPLAPADLTVGTVGLVGLKLVFWINWLLFLVNLLPAFPFDGGRALRAAILMRWPRVGRQAASLMVSGLAKFAAVMIALAAFVLPLDNAHSLVSPHFALILLAIFLFFSAKQEESRSGQEPERNEPSDRHALAEALARRDEDGPEDIPAEPGRFARWLEQRRALRHQRQREQEAEEERRVDEILARLHEQGMDALTPTDRALLERVSARYRSRLRS